MNIFEQWALAAVATVAVTAALAQPQTNKPNILEETGPMNINR